MAVHTLTWQEELTGTAVHRDFSKLEENEKKKNKQKAYLKLEPSSSQF